MEVNEPVSSLFALYLERSDLRPASVEIRQRACDLFIEWFGDMPVGRVKPATAESYRAMLSKTGRGKRGRSQSSVRSYLENFRPFWKWLRDNGYIESDPFANIHIKVDDSPRRETFTPADLGLMVMVADDLERLQICLGLLGCRRGEMLNIQVRDVHLDHPRPHIELVAKAASAHTWPWGTKNHRARLVGIPAAIAFDGVAVELAAEIRKRMMKLGQEPEAYLCIPPERVAVLLDWQKAGKLTWSDIKDPVGNFARHFRQLQKRAGIAKVRRFHELRAAFATAAFDANMQPTRIMQALGHHRIEQTMRYDRKSQMSLVGEMAQIASTAYTAKVAG